jgi:hypothetical protein
MRNPKKNIPMKKLIIAAICIISMQPILIAGERNRDNSLSGNSYTPEEIQFSSYVQRIRNELATNDMIIHRAQDNLAERLSWDKRLSKKIHSLHSENEELEAALKTYEKYGAGDWEIFREEIDQDLYLIRFDRPTRRSARQVTELRCLI